MQAVGVTEFYWADKSLYFVDSITKIIYRTFLERPGRVEAVVKNGLERVSGLAVDWLAGNLYWADSELARIEVSRLNGAYRRVSESCISREVRFMRDAFMSCEC